MRLERTVFCPVAMILTLSACSKSPDAEEAKYMAKGKAEFGKKNYGVALLDFKNASAAKPWDAEPHYQMGLTYLAANDVKSAVEDLKKATDLNPRHTGAQLKLAELMAVSSNKYTLEEAQKHAQAVLASQPDDPDVLNVLGLTNLRLGNTEAAQVFLEQALKKSPDHVRSWVVLSQVKMARNDVAGAEDALLQATAKAPKSPEPRTFLGEFYLARGKVQQAEQQFQQALTIDPKHGPALMDLGAMQVKAGQADLADQTYRRLAALPDRQYRSAYAQFLFQSGKRDQAAAEFERLAAADPEDHNVRTGLIQAYLLLGRAGDAEKILSAAVKKNDTDLEAHMQRGRLYLHLGRYAEAQTDMDHVLQFQKDSAEAHYVLAQIAEARSNGPAQKAELEEALKLDPTLLAARTDLAAWLIANRAPRAALTLVDEAPKDQMDAVAMVLKRNWALLALGQYAEARKGIDRVLVTGKVPEGLLQDAAIKLARKDYAGARKSAEEALSKTPGDTRALFALIDSYTAQKQKAAAIQRTREYAVAEPGSAPVQQFLGMVLSAGGDRVGARKAFEAARAARPGFIEADYSLAELDAGEGKVDDARKRLIGVAAAHPDNKKAHQILAEFEATTGRNPAAAIEQFRKVVAIDPKDASSWNDLAYLLTQGKQLDEALKCAQKAKELAPDSPDVDGTLGWVYYQQGAYPLAVVHLETATAKGGAGKNPAIRQFHLAMAYLKDGKPDRGRQTLDAALKMNPNLPEAQAARQAFGISAK